MVGPTPVSALLHSATMVAAGVFLVARLYPLFVVAAPSLHVVAWVGVVTSLLGGAAALVNHDLKRTLAYSTMSQIGLMFVGLGSGSLVAGILLLVAQAFYKATLFLGAGAVDRAVEGTAFERMGGLARHMPLTAIAFAISSAALAGLPVTLALPPKDPVLAAAWQSNTTLFVVTLVASFLTALYSARIFGLVLLGGASVPASQAREAKKGLLIPLLVMAGLIPIGLLTNAPLLGRPLEYLLGATTPEVALVTLLAFGITVIGVAAGLAARRRWPLSISWPIFNPVAPLFAGEFGLKSFYRVLTHGLFWAVERLDTFDRGVFDRINSGIVRGVLVFIRACAGIDRYIFDAFASRLASATLALVRAAGRFDVRRFDGAVRDIGHGFLTLGQRVRGAQTGRIENYLLVALAWCLGVLAFAALVALMR
jgi:NADH:ubiquinone oxidoreductase subunit 5 (subunit L)/multisubunit Na+/H+ antiporter MnhA subunit